MAKVDFISNSLNDTSRLGKMIAKHAPKGGVIALSGPLAAGKTALSRAVFETLGYNEGIKSPTFTIINEYRSGENRAYHIDVYNLNSSDGLYMAGYEECLDSEITVIEWAERVSDIFDADTIYVDIDIISDNERLFHIQTANAGLIDAIRKDNDENTRD